MIFIHTIIYNHIKMCICFPKADHHCFRYFLAEIDRQQLGESLLGNIQTRAQLLAQRLVAECFDEDATTIIINAKIYTMDEENPVAEAVALKFNKILKVGKQEEILGLKCQGTKVVDLGGRTMLPGFIDPHIHMTFCLLDHWLDLGPFVNKNMDQIKDKLIKAVKQHKDPKVLLTSQLYDPTIMHGTFDVSKEGLDKISKDIGIFILEANGHVAHVNSVALKMAGVDHTTKDPPHGRFIRDQKGQPTGQVQQLAIGYFKKLFDQVTIDQYKENFRKFLAHCASKGCTSLHDCGIGFIDAETDLSVLYSIFNEEDPLIRYSGYLVSTNWKTWQKCKLVPNSKDEGLRINGIKCWADGSTQGGSAYLHQPYTVPKWGHGKPNYTLPQLQASIKKAHDAGWQVGVHTNGDAAIDMVLDAFEAVLKENPKADMRHRIEHATLCSLGQLQRMADLRLTPSFLIGHIYYYGQVFEKILGQQRARKMDPLKSALDLKLTPTIHSDYNCQPVDPLRCLHNAVTRRTRLTHRVINQKQCVSVYEAVKTMTINAAWQCHMEDIVGSIQVGKLGDFVVLDRDLMEIKDGEEIRQVKILQTWMNGKITYDALKK